MYQGKNRTALASQRQIARAMMALMGEGPFIGITVAEVCRRAQVSRQTFYSLFQSKENVVLYLLREGFSVSSVKIEAGDDQLQTLCRTYSMFVDVHREVLLLLAENNLIGLLQDKLYRVLVSSADLCLELREEYREYAATFLAAGMARLTESFVRQGLDPSSMEEITYNLLCGNCRMDN